jgi:hypothetical protein
LVRPDGDYGDGTWWKYVMGEPLRYSRRRLGTTKMFADTAATSSRNPGVINVSVQTHAEEQAPRRREALGRSMEE